MPTSTRTCPSCQTTLPDEAQFCLRCGVATPTDPGVPPRTATTGVVEVAQVKRALADRYRIERVAGEGGMATVYIAEDIKHHRKVAVKVMRPELAATLGADRFLREIDIAAQLNHPHILPVHDSGVADGILYFVMPYVEGETVREKIQREGQLSVTDALRLAREVAEALAYAHKHGIIHRDIKPGNILINSGHALLADFGIARAVGSEGEALTKTGLAVGTPQYMAPEQSSGDREIDGRSDVYAVGAILYEMIAGEPPFTGPNARAILTRSMTESPRSLTSSRAGLSPAVEAVVAKTLAKSPADRYATADELAAALDQTMDQVRSGSMTPVSTPVPAASPIGKSWAIFGISTAVGLGVIYAMVKRYALPNWVLALAALLILIGVVMMVTTTWIEKKRVAMQPMPSWGRFFTWENTRTGGLLALGLWAILATAMVLRGPEGSGAGGAIRLAVLPFINRGGGAEHDYFVDGVTDEVRGKLTRLGDFEVIARSSSDLYRASTKTPGDIGSELGVDYLLTGTVTWIKMGTEDRVQVVPELIDVKTGASRWQQTYSNSVSDVLQLQSSIAGEVASALGVALGGTERDQVADRPTENAAAYDLYLKGRALPGRDPVSARQATNYFEQAVALDQNFLKAWAGLSRSLVILYINGNRDPALGARSREAGDRALALDPNAPDGHVALANHERFVIQDFAAARRHLEAALQFAPNDTEALASLAALHTQEGFPDSAIAVLKRARELDPRSVDVLRGLHRAQLATRSYAEAVATGELALELTPGDILTLQYMAIAHLANGDTSAARQVINRAKRTVPMTVIAANFAGFYETGWILEPADRELLFRLTPGAFDDDRAWWGQSLAVAHWDYGNRARARAYADSALPGSEAQHRANPTDRQSAGLYALMLAYVGRGDEAIAKIQEAIEGTPVRDLNRSYIIQQATRIEIVLGRTDQAFARLRELLSSGGFVNPAYVRVDPMYNPLRNDPRFEAILAGR